MYYVGYPSHNKQPTPLVLDLHGWTGSALSQMGPPWQNVALNNNFIMLWPDGMGDSPDKDGSWNCSRTTGPKGPTCDVNREDWTNITCHYSCPTCSELSSCDWTSCYDDIGFMDYIIEEITEQWCIDLDHIHLSGISNGGMFAYYLAASATDGLGKNHWLYRVPQPNPDCHSTLRVRIRLCHPIPYKYPVLVDSLHRTI